MTDRAASNPVRPGEADADVVVVGLGCAGAAAAIEAAAAGARVVALEGAGGPGGSSALSGGELYLGGGTDLQTACGVTDDPDRMFAYLTAALGPYADEAKLRAYCDGSPEHYRWFVGLGVPFRPSRYDGVSWLPPTEDGLMWLGENAWPFTELTEPAPRGHRPATPGHGGQVLMDRLLAAVDAAGVAVHTDTRAHALETAADGTVVAVHARRFGEDVTYRARRAVVLTTGGFADDETMVADHAPVLSGHGRVSDGRDDGSGIRLGLSVGGTVRRMSTTQIALSAVPALACRGMLVNGRGERFINEDVYPGRFSQGAVLHQPGPGSRSSTSRAGTRSPSPSAGASSRSRSAPTSPSSSPRSGCRPAPWSPPSTATTATLRRGWTSSTTRTPAGCGRSVRRTR